MRKLVRARTIFAGVGALAVLGGALGAGAAGASPQSPLRHEMRQSVRGSAQPAAHLTWWGGRTVRAIRVVQVVWGRGRFAAGVTTTKAPNIGTFYAGIVRSPYVDWLKEYNTRLDSIGEGSFAGKFTITPSAHNNSAHVDDLKNIRPELTAQIRARHLPAPDANTVYALFFHSGQIVTQGGADSATGFCAYHSTASWNAWANIRYMVLPAAAAASQCGPTTGFGNLTSAASHELVETITDPDVGMAVRLAPPLSWYDPLHGEVADICEGRRTIVRAGDGRDYVVQKNWSNRRKACAAT